MLSEAASAGETQGYGPDVRLALLGALSRIMPTAKSLPADQIWLLSSVQSVEEFHGLVRERVPASWLGQAAALSLPSVALTALASYDDARLSGFAAGVSTRSDAVEFLARLAPNGGAGPPPWLARMLVLPEFEFPPNALDRLLVQLNADTAGWDAFWKTPGTLATILAKLPTGGEFEIKLWEHLCACALFERKDLVFGIGARAPRLETLVSARNRLGALVPAKFAEWLDDCDLIAAQLAGPPRPVADEATLRAALPASVPRTRQSAPRRLEKRGRSRCSPPHPPHDHSKDRPRSSRLPYHRRGQAQRVARSAGHPAARRLAHTGRFINPSSSRPRFLRNQPARLAPAVPVAP